MKQNKPLSSSSIIIDHGHGRDNDEFVPLNDVLEAVQGLKSFAPFHDEDAIHCRECKSNSFSWVVA